MLSTVSPFIKCNMFRKQVLQPKQKKERDKANFFAQDFHKVEDHKKLVMTHAAVDS